MARSLLVKVGMDLTSFERGVARMERSTIRFARNLPRMLGGAVRTAAMGGGIGGVAGGALLGSRLETARQAITEAEKIGMTPGEMYSLGQFEDRMFTPGLGRDLLSSVYNLKIQAKAKGGGQAAGNLAFLTGGLTEGTNEELVLAMLMNFRRKNQYGQADMMQMMPALKSQSIRNPIWITEFQKSLAEGRNVHQAGDIQDLAKVEETWERTKQRFGNWANQAIAFAARTSEDIAEAYVPGSTDKYWRIDRQRWDTQRPDRSHIGRYIENPPPRGQPPESTDERGEFITIKEGSSLDNAVKLLKEIRDEVRKQDPNR